MAQVKTASFSGGELDGNTRIATENFLTHQQPSSAGVTVKLIAAEYKYEITGPDKTPEPEYPPGYDPELFGEWPPKP